MALDLDGWQQMMDRVLNAAKAPPNMAPYRISKRGDKFVVVNNANEVKATFDDYKAALKYQRALYLNVPGATDAANRKEWTGKQKRAS